MSASKSNEMIVLSTIVVILLGITTGMPAGSATRDPAPITFNSPNAQPDGYFGFSVAVSGTSMVVGAPQEYANGLFHAGHVYVFSTAGSLLATLTSPNALVSGELGWSVAVSGMNVVVGAPFETASGLLQAGHAYIFSSTGSLIATLTSPNAQTQGFFGYSVAVSGRSVIVGAPFENANGFLEAGHAYIFSTAGSLIANLTSPNAIVGGEVFGEFGWSVAVSGGSVVVGAPYDNAGVESQAGHAYIFSSTGSLIATLTSPNAQTGGRFGASVAMSGRRVIVGAPWEAPNGQFYVGHAYICTATECPPTGTLTSPNAQTQGWFGNSVAISGMTGEVGAPYEGGPGLSVSGRTYIFSARSFLINTLTSPNALPGEAFGFSIAVDGPSLVVGALEGNPTGAGHAYLYATAFVR